MISGKKQLQVNLSVRNDEDMNESSHREASSLGDVEEKLPIGFTGELDMKRKREEES